MDSNEGEAEVRSKEIADRLKVDWAELKARASKNAETVEAWSVLKQAQFEEFMQGEKAAEDRYKADREAAPEIEKAPAAPPPSPERVPDVWESVLAGVENMPDVSGSLERGNDHIKATSMFLLTQVLGIGRKEITQDHTARLHDAMLCLGWRKPPNLWIGAKAAKGYRKELDEPQAQ
jgi:hypothetical protein